MTLKRGHRANCIATLGAAALVVMQWVPLAAHAALFKPEPVLTISALEKDGKSVAQFDALDLRVLPSRRPTPVTLANGGAIPRGMTLRTPIASTMVLQSANGVMICMEPDAELYVDSVTADGESYTVARGRVQFSMMRKLGYFVVKHGTILAQTRQAQFSVAVLDDKKTANFSVMHGNIAVDEPVAFIDAEKNVTAISFETVSVAEGQSRTVSDTAKLRKKVRFENFDAIQASLDAAIKSAIEPAQRINASRQALDIARKFKNSSKVLAYNTAWLEAMANAGESNKVLQFENALSVANFCAESKIFECALAQFKRAVALGEILFEDWLNLNLILARMGVVAQQKTHGEEAPSQSYVAQTSRQGSRLSADNDTSVIMTKRAKIVYPKLMQVNGFEADGLVMVEIAATGKIDAVKVLRSSHPAFEKVMVRAMLESEFAPPKRDGIPVSGEATIPFNFRMKSTPNSLPNAPIFFPKVPNPKLPAELQYDEPPVIKLVTPVVYPRQLLIDWTNGSATVKGAMDDKGAVVGVEVLEATHPEFGAAAKAMVQTWEFLPAIKDDEAIPNMFTYTQQFNRKEYDTGSDKRMRSILYELDSGSADFVEMSALDTRPNALYQPTPYDPQPAQAGISQPESVVVEFFIDSEGAVQLPRVVSAKNMHRGWAAATALQRWIFEVPKIKGKAVNVRHEMVFKFD